MFIATAPIEWLLHVALCIRNLALTSDIIIFTVICVFKSLLKFHSNSADGCT